MEKVEDLAVSVHKWDLVVRKNSFVIARTQDFGLPIAGGGHALTLLRGDFGHLQQSHGKIGFFAVNPLVAAEATRYYYWYVNLSMVYSLRVLHHLLDEGKAFGTAEQAMEAVFEILKEEQAVASEVFLAKKDEAAWQQT